MVVDAFLNLFSSPATQQTYRQDLEDFFSFIEKMLGQPLENFEQITEKMLIVYQHSLKEYKPSYRNRKISSVSSFLNYCVQKRIVSKNVALFLKRDQKPPQSTRAVLTTEEVKKMLDVCRANARIFESQNNRSEFEIWLTYYTVLKVFFTVGLRVSEICSLTTDALEATGSGHFRLRLVAKGQEQHAPLIHPQTVQDIQTYQEKIHTTTHLFVLKGKPLNRTAVYRIVALCAKEAGIAKHITPHGCRATLATLLHRQGVPVGEIKALLNHKNIKTTALYIQAAQEYENAASIKIDIIG
jgi:integrase/recombinase XerD